MGNSGVEKKTELMYFKSILKFCVFYTMAKRWISASLRFLEERKLEHFTCVNKSTLQQTKLKSENNNLRAN